MGLPDPMPDYAPHFLCCKRIRADGRMGHEAGEMPARQPKGFQPAYRLKARPPTIFLLRHDMAMCCHMRKLTDSCQEQSSSASLSFDLVKQLVHAHSPKARLDTNGVGGDGNLSPSVLYAA